MKAFLTLTTLVLATSVFADTKMVKGKSALYRAIGDQYVLRIEGAAAEKINRD